MCVYNEQPKKENLRETTGYDILVSLYGEGLVNAEIALELEAKELAYNAFMRRLNQAKADKKAATQGTAKVVSEQALPLFVKGLQDFFSKAEEGKAGRRHTLISVFKELPVEQVAYVSLQKILGMSIQGNIKLTALAAELGGVVEEEILFQRILSALGPREKAAFLEGLSKRIGASFKEAYVRAKRRRLEDEKGLQVETWDSSKRGNVGLKLVDIFMTSTGMATLRRVGSSKGICYDFELEATLVEYVLKNDKELADLAFQHRPMVIPPLDWTSPWNGGYLLNLKQPISFVRLPSKVVHNIYDDLDMPVVYKAVNAIQKTPWRINRRVLEIAKEVSSWREIPSELDMPEAEAKEPPVRPAEADLNPEVQKEWRSSMVHYYQQDNKRKSRRFTINSVLSLAEKYKDYKAIYFPHNLDFRGRIYPLTVLSPQGTDFTKSLIEFADGCAVGSTGGRWLAFQLANCFGLDKRPLEERLAWPYENTEMILKIAKKPLDNLEWMSADSPWEFLAACFEWADYMDQGESYVSHLPIAFDGSCSGIQHFSAMLKDEIGGKAVNLIPSDNVQDIYAIVAEVVKERLKRDATSGTIDEVVSTEDEGEYLKKGTKALAEEWLKHGVTRKVTKRPTMTLSYGAKLYGFKEQILEDTVYPALEHNPLAFSKPSQAAAYMADLVWQSLGSVVVKAREAMEWLQDASALLAGAKDLSGKSMPTSWITPAGFPVRQAYPKVRLKQLRTLLSGKILVQDLSGKVVEKENEGKLSIAINEEVGGLDSRKQRNGIAPNFVHSMDASHLMLTVCACVDQGVHQFAMIHDSYGCPAGQGDIMFATVRQAFVDTYTKNNVLQDLHDQIANLLPEKEAKKLKPCPEEGALDLEVVKQSLYAFS